MRDKKLKKSHSNKNLDKKQEKIQKKIYKLVFEEKRKGISFCYPFIATRALLV